jgi:hypothetical protein
MTCTICQIWQVKITKGRFAVYLAKSLVQKDSQGYRKSLVIRYEEIKMFGLKTKSSLGLDFHRGQGLYT